MKISAKARYGLRAISCIASQSEGMTKSEFLAKNEGISKKYLDSILGILRKKGLLNTLRGAYGGYALSRPAKEITVLDVLTALDEDTALVKCLKNPELCERVKNCKTLFVWEQAEKALNETFSRITIEDIVLNQVDNSC